MRRVEGSSGVSLMECTNPVKDKWRIRWDVQEKENGSASYMEEEFGHKPTDEEIHTLVMSWYNSQTDAKSSNLLLKSFTISIISSALSTCPSLNVNMI